MKRFIAFLLTLCMIFGCIIPSFSEGEINSPSVEIEVIIPTEVPTEEVAITEEPVPEITITEVPTEEPTFTPTPEPTSTPTPEPTSVPMELVKLKIKTNIPPESVVPGDSFTATAVVNDPGNRHWEIEWQLSYSKNFEDYIILGHGETITFTITVEMMGQYIRFNASTDE